MLFSKLVLGVFVLSTVMVHASVTWTVANGQLLKNGVPTTLKGLAVTCMEYLLSGLGTDCLATYDFNNKSGVITLLNTAEMQKIYSILLPAPKASIQPTIRLQLNAGYYLNVSTPRWQLNQATFPDLSLQYQQLVDLVVQDASNHGIVTVIDLHWSDDVSQFSPMALKGSSQSGDAVTFWNQIATRYASNPFVFYELFSSPHIDSYLTWMEGDTQFEGMRKMTAAVLTKNIKGMVLIGGQQGFAYDAPSLLQYTTDINNHDRALYVFHPYMGPDQAQDVAKGVPGFIDRVDQVLATTKRPIVLTELGQFCCPAEGPCFIHNGQNEGVSMGYVRAILFESSKRNISWTGFGYRPGSGGNCTNPDVNDGGVLYSSARHNQNGADWATLFPTFFAADANALPPLQPPTSIAVPVGIGVGGALILAAAVGFLIRWHRGEKRKRVEAELARWTPNEVRALQEKYQVTHDFDELCSVVPHRTRESVAWKAKSFQQKTKSTFIQNFQRTASFVPSERFNFLSPRRPYNIPRPSFRPPTRDGTMMSSFSLSPFASARESNVSHSPSLYRQPVVAAANPKYVDSLRTTVSY